jgi:hypothetical protein
MEEEEEEEYEQNIKKLKDKLRRLGKSKQIRNRVASRSYDHLTMHRLLDRNCKSKSDILDVLRNRYRVQIYELRKKQITSEYWLQKLNKEFPGLRQREDYDRY